MPINIADQFKVNVALPIDSRIVASGSNKDLIQFKYDGLRVFDTSNRLTYIWNATTSTFSVADINGSGQTNYMTRWSSTGLTSSGIYYAVGSSINKGNVGINTSSPQAVLQINSDTGLSQPFVIHKGASTLLAYNFYNDGTNKSFDPGFGSGAIRFSDSGNIDFLTRSAGVGIPAINSGNDDNLAFQIQSGTGWAYLFKNLILSGDTTIPASSLFLRSQNTFSTSTTPDVTWYNNDNTGIFHPANFQIGFSIGGLQRVRLTSTGLLLGGAAGSLVVPQNKLHLDNGNGAASYIQFTAGTTTGTGASDGFLVGINSSGYPVLQSNDNFAISTTFGGKHQHKLDINSFTIYSDPNGVGFNDITGFTGKRVTRATKSVSTSSSGPQSLVITSFSVPASSMCSLEITFVTALKITSGVFSGTFQYKTQKLLISFSVASVALLGAITIQNTGAVVPAGGGALESHDIKTLTSTSATNIGKGFLTYFPGNVGNGYAAFVNISQQLNIVAPAISYTSTVVVDYKLIVNHHQL